MIKISNVRKEFQEIEAIENVSIHVNKGSIYGLLGSNGAGKTTLLKMIAGIYEQSEGSILIDGRVVYENPSLKQEIIIIQDTPFFIPQYTLKQMGKVYRSFYPNWSEERFKQLAADFNLDVTKKIHKFSKGIQRQAAFILALSAQPSVLILDEPMDGLDPVMRKKVKSLIFEDVADREMSVLISSHNLKEVEDICDHVGILHKGKMILERDLDDLKSDTHKIQLAFKGEIPQQLISSLDIVHQEKRGSIFICIVKGLEEELLTKIQTYHPVILDILPLTLEEIFLYEMEDAGYAVQNILD
ncbi:ABC transporter ATP-binding protein [Cytobacillus gottheilii]|uniref:ABC transporter ATP-binding protein n=1 Tax=Cytobacillus gottheilii TaxID=859144 RepID=A0ABX8F8Z7_9BACI|nr:ABC transporter ATP-binding protein [Cytobacillus gottheilii]QVY59951.1 ABC transporter ATP-binding protein [Cytobacillus gottheilii]